MTWFSFTYLFVKVIVESSSKFIWDDVVKIMCILTIRIEDTSNPSGELLRLTTNLGYPVDLFYVFIRVCWYDLQLTWATRLICFICLFVYVGTTYN